MAKFFLLKNSSLTPAIATVVALLGSFVATVATAQETNSARVINQGSIGLGRPSGTYIGPGTVSNSARGSYGAGAQVNPGLPRVNMGANVATPGDNMYGPAPTQVRQAAPAQQTYYQNQSAGGANPNLPAARLGASVGIAGDNIRSDMNGPNQVRKAPATTFYPRSNQTPMYNQQQQYAQQPQAPSVGTYNDAVPVKQEIHF